MRCCYRLFYVLSHFLAQPCCLTGSRPEINSIRPYLLSAARVRASPLRTVVEEENINALVAFLQSRADSGPQSGISLFRSYSAALSNTQGEAEQVLGTLSAMEENTNVTTDTTTTKERSVGVSGGSAVGDVPAAFERAVPENESRASPMRGRSTLVRSTSNTARAAESTPIWSVATGETETAATVTEKTESTKPGADAGGYSKSYIPPKVATAVERAQADARRQRPKRVGGFLSLLPDRATVLVSPFFDVSADFEAFRIEVVGDCANIPYQATCEGISHFQGEVTFPAADFSGDILEEYAPQSHADGCSSRDGITSEIAGRRNRKLTGGGIQRGNEGGGVGLNPRVVRRSNMSAVAEIRGVGVSLSAGDGGRSGGKDGQKGEGDIDKVRSFRWSSSEEEWRVDGDLVPTEGCRGLRILFALVVFPHWCLTKVPSFWYTGAIVERVFYVSGALEAKFLSVTGASGCKRIEIRLLTSPLNSSRT